MAFKKLDAGIMAVIIVLLIGAMYYYVSLSSTLIFGDETYYASEARTIQQSGFLPKFDVFHSTDIWHIQFIRPPIYIMMASFGYSLLGELGIKLIVPIFTILSALMAYLLMKRAGKPRAGLAAAFLLMLMPGIVTYGVMNYVETCLMFFFILTLYFGYVCAETKSVKYAVLTGIAAMFAILTDASGVFVMAILLFYFIVLSLKDKSYKQHAKLFGIIALVAIVLVSPYFIRQMALWGSACYEPFISYGTCSGVADVQIPKLGGLSFEAAVAPTGTGLPILQYGILNYIAFAFGLPLLVFLCLGISGVFSKKSDLSKLLLIWLAFFLLITAAVATSFRSEDAIRFTLFGLPVLTLISGLFLSDMYDRFDKHKFIVMLVILFILVPSFYFGYDKLNNMQTLKQNSFQGLTAACSWVKQNTATDSVIYATYAHQTAWLCERSAKTTVPDKEEIALTNNDTSYEHLKLHGYDYVLIEAFTVSNSRYEEGNTVDFVNYLLTSSRFKKVYDNTNIYGQNGILIFQVL